MRTWSAKIVVRESGQIARHDATESDYDLLRDQVLGAVSEAALLVTQRSEVHVVIYKTTKARGTLPDRSFSVFRDRRGQVRFQ